MIMEKKTKQKNTNVLRGIDIDATFFNDKRFRETWNSNGPEIDQSRYIMFER